MMKKVADRGVATKSRLMAARHIALAICGGIAATEMVKITRELRRHQATTLAFFSPETERFIGKLSLEWATGRPVVCETGAEVEHLEPFDLVLVAPATLNTLSKSALGIADNAVTLLIASALGNRTPLLFVPTMNEQLQQHPLYSIYTTQLKKWGAHILETSTEESRLKMPSPEVVVSHVLKLLK